MPFPDAKYPFDQRLVRAAPAMLETLRRAQSTFAELDGVWRTADATYVDQLICGPDGLRGADEAIYNATGKGGE